MYVSSNSISLGLVANDRMEEGIFWHLTAVLFQIGVLVLLASISNMFCVACGFTGFHNHLSFAHSYSAAQGLNEKVVPIITSGYFGYTSTDQRWLLGGLNGPTVMWSSTKTAYIMWPLYACGVMGMLVWCCEFLGITVNLDSVSYSPMDVDTFPSP